jgi:hypothetical protein
MSIEKLANAAIGSGSGAAVVFGLTPSEWSVVGVIGGLVVAVAGLIVQVWFKNKHLQLARERAWAGDDE